MILDEIAEKTKKRIQEQKQIIGLEAIKKMAEDMPKDTEFPFEKALKAEGMSYICEIKKASPSKGVIAKDFPYLEIAKEYEKAGAAAISCLTEPFYFQGDNQYLSEIAKAVQIPILRKDFTVDSYMIYEAKILGASAILLICAILDDRELKEFYEIAQQLGLSVLVEAHTEQEVLRAINCGARIIGVNNRDLKTFQVDITNSVKLRDMVPKSYIYVSESGIRTAEDVRVLKDNNTNAVLIGETLMKAVDKKAELEKLSGGMV